MDGSLGIYNLIDEGGIKKSIERVINSNVNYNTYVTPKGLKRLRETLARFLHDTWNYQDSAKEILITSGSQQSLNLIAQAILDPKDTVLIEQPTYFGTIDVLKRRKVNILAIDLTNDGLDMIKLEKMLKENKPKAIYVVPTFNNPTGYSWSNEKRREFLELINKYDVLVIEDDPYRFINYTDNVYRTLYEMNRGKNIIYLGTFSKLISPSINVGYIITNDEKIMNKLYEFKNSFDLCTSLFLQYVVDDYLNSNNLLEIIEGKKEIYKSLYAKSLREIKEEYGDKILRMTKPLGGLFYLVEFKEKGDFPSVQDYYVEDDKKRIETRINICSFMD